MAVKPPFKSPPPPPLETLPLRKETQTPAGAAQRVILQEEDKQEPDMTVTPIA